MEFKAKLCFGLQKALKLILHIQRQKDAMVHIAKLYEQNREQFKSILDSFFPRYIDILQNYQKDIIAVRIEGHTSSDWNIVIPC